MKRCPKCERMLTPDDFHRRRDTRDGRQYICRDCVSEARRLQGRNSRWEPQRGDEYEPLYVRVPIDTKQRVAALAQHKKLSLAKTTAMLLNMSLTMVERRAQEQGVTLVERHD